MDPSSEQREQKLKDKIESLRSHLEQLAHRFSVIEESKQELVDAYEARIKEMQLHADEAATAKGREIEDLEEKVKGLEDQVGTKEEQIVGLQAGLKKAIKDTDTDAGELDDFKDTIWEILQDRWRHEYTFR